MHCPNCGTQNAETSRFCLKCGTALAAVAPPAAYSELRHTPASVSPDRRTRRRLLTGGIVIVALIAALALVSQGGVWKPSKPGVYLKSSRMELRREQAMNPQQQGVPRTTEKQPVLLVYLPGEDTQYLQLMRVSGGARDLGFGTLSFDKGVYEIQPLNELGGGVYCVVLGGPLMLPTDVSWWCF